MNPIAALFAPFALAGTLPSVHGAINPDITQANIHSTICVPGYTKTIRPSTKYTNPLKRKQMAQFGISDSVRNYEEDHLVPLSLGGDPYSPDNLWPEPWHGPWNAHIKDRLELKLHRMVCDGDLPLIVAQQAFETNWIESYQKYLGNAPAPHKHRKKSWRRKYF